MVSPVATTSPRRRSLRRLEIAVSAMALGTALWLGLTAPTVSPVTPSVAPPVAAPAVPGPATP